MPERAAPLLRVVTGEVERRGAEVEANLGNTRVFNAARGDAPPGVDVLGPTSGAATCPRSSVASSLSACPPGPQPTSPSYARGHDDAVWAAVEGLLSDQRPGEGHNWAATRQVVFLPPSLGGLRHLAAERVSPAAYWAAWANALPVLRPHPDAAARLVTPCRRACAEAARQLAAEGWTSRPEWASCARGADSPAAEG